MPPTTPIPGALFLAIDAANGGHRDRMRIGNLLANDILRISRGAADRIAEAIMYPERNIDPSVVIGGLRDRLAMAEEVIRLIRDERASGKAET